MKSGFLTAIILLIALPAMAKTKSKAPEVYAATDANESVMEQPGEMAPEEGVSQPAAPVATAPLSAPAAQPAPAASTRSSARAVAPAPKAIAKRKAFDAKFDKVPASQIEPLMARLQIVETLVQKYGRAYDYRQYTLKQLQLIQRQLEAQNAPKAAPRATQSAVGPRVRIPPAPIAAPAAAPAGDTQQAGTTSDTIATGQAAATENSETPDLKSLPAPAEMDPANGSDAASQE